VGQLFFNHSNGSEVPCGLNFSRELNLAGRCLGFQQCIGESPGQHIRNNTELHASHPLYGIKYLIYNGLLAQWLRETHWNLTPVRTGTLFVLHEQPQSKNNYDSVGVL
jgi:hypothetical protein